jgi:hypothetical protein
MTAWRDQYDDKLSLCSASDSFRIATLPVFANSDFRATRAGLVLGIALALIGCRGGNPNRAASSSDGGASISADMSFASCDLIKQDCSAGQKCVPDLDSDTAGAGRCVRAGTVAEGQPCTYDDPAADVAGDNCAPGLKCDSAGSDAADTCQKLCSSDATCTTPGQRCADLYLGGFGYCISTCTLFGNDCAQGSSCAGLVPAFGQSDPAGGVFVCKTTGPGQAFTGCDVDEDCGDNLLCDGDQLWCIPVCDGKHPCSLVAPTDGGAAPSCRPIANLPDGQGACR